MMIWCVLNCACDTLFVGFILGFFLFIPLKQGAPFKTSQRQGLIQCWAELISNTIWWFLTCIPTSLLCKFIKVLSSLLVSFSLLTLSSPAFKNSLAYLAPASILSPHPPHWYSFSKPSGLLSRLQPHKLRLPPTHARAMEWATPADAMA